MTPADSAVERIYAAVARIEGIYGAWSNDQGLTYYEMQFYYALMRRPDRTATQAEICRALDAPKTTVNSLVKAQIAKGLVLLGADCADRRRKTLILTPRGRAFAEGLVGPLRDHERDAAAALAEDDVERTVATLTAFADALERRLRPRRPAGARPTSTTTTTQEEKP